MQAGDSTELIVGLDIGGTKIAALVVDQNGCELGQAIQPTKIADHTEILTSIINTIDAGLAEAGATPNQIYGIGLGVPGKINPTTGTVELAVNLNLSDYPLGPLISSHFNAPTVLENDVRIAAIGAYHYLHRMESIRHMAYLSVGTGIAAGVILNGRLYRGHSGMAGEIGHLITEPNGTRCNCGLRGCLEATVAGPAIIRRMLAAEPQIEQKIQHAGDVYDAAKNGNLIAQQVVKHVSFHLAKAIQWLIMTYDVEKITIGGGVSHSAQQFLAPILQELATMRQQSPLAAELLKDEKLLLMPFDFNAGVWGAVHLARQRIREKAT